MVAASLIRCALSVATGGGDSAEYTDCLKAHSGNQRRRRAVGFFGDSQLSAVSLGALNGLPDAMRSIKAPGAPHQLKFTSILIGLLRPVVVYYSDAPLPPDDLRRDR